MDKLNMSPWETPANLQAFLKPSVKVWPYSEGWIGQLTSPTMHFDGKRSGRFLLKLSFAQCAMCFWNEHCAFAMCNVVLHMCNVQLQCDFEIGILHNMQCEMCFCTMCKRQPPSIPTHPVCVSQLPGITIRVRPSWTSWVVLEVTVPAPYFGLQKWQNWAPIGQFLRPKIWESRQKLHTKGKHNIVTSEKCGFKYFVKGQETNVWLYNLFRLMPWTN